MNRLCVYCGSSPGRDRGYLEAARALARLLARRCVGIVYGGSSVGLMGEMADAALAAGGEVIGVIPDALMGKELGHQGLTELRVVASMHERKATMADLSDGFIAMPGGLGTLEELFEILTWAQLGFHDKPCGVLNVGGYYDSLARFLDHAVQEGFLRPQHRAMLMLESEPEALLARFGEYTAPAVPKWLDRAEI